MAEEAIDLDIDEMAAIVLMVVGEETASEVMKHMGPKEVQKLGFAISNIADLTKEKISMSISTFMATVHTQTALGVGKDDYLRTVLVNALGEEKAAGIIDRILLGGNAKGLESLKWMNAKSVAELIGNEHPQIIAIVLSYLESEQSAEVLACFPENMRTDLLMRVATLEGVQPAALKQLNSNLEQQLKGGSTIQASSIGGVQAAANILNFIDGNVETEIIEKVKTTDDDLGQKIQDLMFVFDNLNDMDDRGMQTLLREVSTDQLLLALRATEAELKEKIFRNMSKRAAEMLRDDLEASGPVKLSEVETAHKDILAIARRLADEGQLMLGGGGGDEMI